MNIKPHRVNPGILSALAAAILFGASTPLAKWLVGQMSPVLLAGLLYLGSGVGLSSWWVVRRARGYEAVVFERGDLPWLAGAVLFGGIVGPLLLMMGLERTPAANASLLLNLEGVLTALLAWWVFREHYERRLVLGMGLITLAGMLLVWPGTAGAMPAPGSLAVVGACLCWAIDNNLTRRVSAGDPALIAAAKGLVAGSVNVGIALLTGAQLPPAAVWVAAGAVGLAGYGLSLVLFVLALRHLGAARTGAYFSLAPFIGAGVALAVLHETVGMLFWLAALLMALGLWLHLAERHAHPHRHEALAHTHRHGHDEHHQHDHDFPYDGVETHVHHHVHAPLMHSHPHYPDIHHRHRH